MDKSISWAYEQGLKKVQYMRETLSGFPHITKDGKWLTNKNGHWTGGFWTGLIWLEALQKGDEAIFKEAKKWAATLKCRINDNKTHDQGFIFGPSCVMGYRITKDTDYLPLIHAGAENMLDLYNEKSGLILAWDEPSYEGIAIVDTIMNVPLMWISDELKGETKKKEIALVVADNIKKYHVRKDSSTYHTAIWDNDYNITGGTHQGYAAESCWSRGQAWALYGFGNLYRYTCNESYLDTGIKLAEYFYSHLNKNLLPAWDLVFQNDDTQPIDASAASIAAAGMLNLAYMLGKKGDMAGMDKWIGRAASILQSEIELCLYKDLDKYGIIENAIVDFPRKSGIGESTMYGDYYFMEALYRLQNMDNPEKLELLY